MRLNFNMGISNFKKIGIDIISFGKEGIIFIFDN